ncbi:hypothetical protein QZH41_006903 [Actinostola sp. cb2023]|nr:hypothetical protein QZH41_006903 [Actinostola sp. cb2023]
MGQERNAVEHATNEGPTMTSFQGPGVSNPVYDVSQSIVVDVVNDDEEAEVEPEERLRTVSNGSLLCILDVSVGSDRNNTIQEESKEETDAILIDDHRKPCKDDAIIDLNIDSKALYFVNIFLLVTLQRIPRHYSSRVKTFLSIAQCFAVVGMIVANVYDMGAFPGTNTLASNQWDNVVTSVKNVISNAKFPLLYIVGIFYFRTRHLEDMLSGVRLTKRYWNYGRKHRASNGCDQSLLGRGPKPRSSGNENGHDS